MIEPRPDVVDSPPLIGGCQKQSGVACGRDGFLAHLGAYDVGVNMAEVEKGVRVWGDRDQRPVEVPDKAGEHEPVIAIRARTPLRRSNRGMEWME